MADVKILSVSEALENCLASLRHQSLFNSVDCSEAIDEAHRTLAAFYDDAAVDRFATTMKEKLAKARASGRHGWYDPAICSGDALRRMLMEHIEKGDPIDVGNFAMMLFNRGEPTNEAN